MNSPMKSPSKNFNLLSETIEDVIASLDSALPAAKPKLDQFVSEYDKAFPREDNPYDRGRAEAITWALMGTPLLLLTIGMNGPVITELHAILERLAIRELAWHIAAAKHRKVAANLVERFTLPDLVSQLCELNILDKEDAKYARQLNTLRNGIAHKNPRGISNTLLSGKEFSFLDVDSVVMTNIDCIPLLISAIRFLLKLSAARNAGNKD